MTSSVYRELVFLVPLQVLTDQMIITYINFKRTDPYVCLQSGYLGNFSDK